ncbi:MAG: hypothetical protein P8Q45_03590 [Candidatus Thalassarchaeaceae archaeon]|nr:hypothetical protein [Candidatus Thalassarchaeaceae archaeon]
MNDDGRRLEELLASREKYLSKALSIAHGRPLHNVIKIKPPMVLNGEDVEITLKLLDEGLASL